MTHAEEEPPDLVERADLRDAADAEGRILMSSRIRRMTVPASHMPEICKTRRTDLHMSCAFGNV